MLPAYGYIFTHCLFDFGPWEMQHARTGVGVWWFEMSAAQQCCSVEGGICFPAGANFAHAELTIEGNSCYSIHSRIKI